MRLIDADRLKSYIDCGHLRPPTEVCLSELDVCNMIDKAPTVSAEAVEVVRCKDCKNRVSDACPMFFEEWFTIDGGDGYVDDDYREHDYTTDEGYCHWGERREDGEA